MEYFRGGVLKGGVHLKSILSLVTVDHAHWTKGGARDGGAIL